MKELMDLEISHAAEKLDKTVASLIKVAGGGRWLRARSSIDLGLEGHMSIRLA